MDAKAMIGVLASPVFTNMPYKKEERLYPTRGRSPGMRSRLECWFLGISAITHAPCSHAIICLLEGNFLNEA